MNGVDYSLSRPGGAALKAAGITFAVRYVWYRDAARGAYAKFLTADEVADLHAHGIAVVANLESTATRARDGAGAGKMDAQDAAKALRDLGAPDSMPIYFSVDFDTIPGYYPAIDAYLRAAAGVIGADRVGVYGEYALIEHAASKQVARWFWQTRAWSAGKISKHAHLYQYETGSTGAKPINGAAVDYDRAIGPSFGQWRPPGKEEDMALSFSVVGPGGRALVTETGHELFRLSDPSVRRTLAVAESIPVAAEIHLDEPLDGHAGDRQSALLFVGEADLPAEAALASDVTFVPAPSAAVASVTINYSDGRSAVLRTA